jgi:hypothetical protein
MVRALIVIFSAGWLIPLWVSANAMYSFFDLELWPRLRGVVPLNSFPFVRFSEQAFTMACIWLGLVIVFWSWRLTGDRKT